MNTNNNGFITVEIQYRLGAFGYLASADVKANGQLNSGLLDQRFALQWVQQHISKFGGDPSRVTVGGESSGAASAMYHALAYGGRNSSLFNNVRILLPLILSPPTSRSRKLAVLRPAQVLLMSRRRSSLPVHTLRISIGIMTPLLQAIITPSPNWLAAVQTLPISAIIRIPSIA